MSADLHIQIMTSNISEDDIASFFCHTMGSKHFDPNKVLQDTNTSKLIEGSPNIWVGEVSWLKAMLFEDDSYIPSIVQEISNIIGQDLPVIDDDLIDKIKSAYKKCKNNTSYIVSTEDKVINFLDQYRGNKAFTVSW